MTCAKRISVLLADDHMLVREGFVTPNPLPLVNRSWPNESIGRFKWLTRNHDMRSKLHEHLSESFFALVLIRFLKKQLAPFLLGH